MIIRASWSRWRVFIAVVGLANPCRRIEQEGEPADPAPELNPADCLDAWGKVDDPTPESVEDAQSRF